jgi:hypothetical protein
MQKDQRPQQARRLPQFFSKTAAYPLQALFYYA